MVFLTQEEKTSDVKEEWIRFRVDPGMKKDWLALCTRRGETEAELGRKIVAKTIAQGQIEGGLDEIINIFRTSLKDVLDPHTERLAKLNAKTAIAAATSMYMNTQVVANAGQDAKTIYEESRKKAVKFVQERQNS